MSGIIFMRVNVLGFFFKQCYKTFAWKLRTYNSDMKQTRYIDMCTAILKGFSCNVRFYSP